MDEQRKNYSNFRALTDYYFKITKRWWAVTWSLKAAVFAVGLIAVFFPNISIYITISVGILSFASEFCNVKSNHNKGIAEGFLRKLDFRDSFGWDISTLEIADAFVKLSKKAKEQFALAGQPDNYFASNETTGWKRAMQNLQESAWWSKHLAEVAGWYCFSLTIILVVVSLLTLIGSSLMISKTEELTNINRIVIAVLLIIVSFGLIPLTFNYFTFSKKAEASERIATELLKTDSANIEAQAIKAFNEYHLVRASAPLIPSWLWRRKKDTLNEAWKCFIKN
jgi:hypothetical protein